MSAPDVAGAAGGSGQSAAPGWGDVAGPEPCAGRRGAIAPKIAVKLSAPLGGGPAGGVGITSFFAVRPLGGESMMSVGTSDSSILGGSLRGGGVSGAETAPNS